MLNAMFYLQRQYPTKIRSVEWFTFETGFCSGQVPKLIALAPFRDAEKVDTKTRNWLYYDVANKVPRGVLVARLLVGIKTVFIVEIRRRARRKQEDDGTSKETEESFKGIVFILDQNQSLQKWLTELLSEIRKEVGVVKKITGRCPGIADTFKHSSSGSDEISCQAAVVNALKKMRIHL
jgi:hypothetical protein